MSVVTDRLKRISAQTAQESGLLVDDSEAHSLAGLYVERDVEPTIVQSLARAAACTVLEGEAGTGKTSLLWHVHRRLETEGTLSLFLRGDTVVTIGPDELLQGLNELRSEGARPSLLIDTADVVLAGSAGREALIGAIEAATQLGCAVLVASRLDESRRFLGAYDKTPVPADYSEREFIQVVETHARYFYRNVDVGSLERRVAEVQGLVAQGRPVAQLATRPLFLRMLFSLYAPHEIPSDVNIANLYSAYWLRRVRTDWRAGRPEPEVSAVDCSAAAQSLAEIMLQEGVIRVSGDRIDAILSTRGTDRRAIDQLVTRGVLRRVASSAGIEALEFFHQTFFEHAAARAVLAGHGALGIDLVGERLATHPEDYFRLPTFEHVLVLSQSSPLDVRTRGEHWIGQVLRHGPPHLGGPAITAYAQLGTVSDSLREAFEHALSDRHLAAPYIASTSASPPTRWPEVWSTFKRLWAAETEGEGTRKPWATRRAILRQLPRLARMTENSPHEMTLFLRDQAVADTIEVDVVADLLPILNLAAASGEPAALQILQSLFGRVAKQFAGHEKAVMSLAMALAEHPKAARSLLENIAHDLAASSQELTARARGVVEAALWRRDDAPVLDQLAEPILSAPSTLAALSAWLGRRDEADWRRAWDCFASQVEESARRDWVHRLWDRLAVHPFDRGEFLPIRTRDFLVDQVAAAVMAGQAGGEAAAIAVCRYSRSFDLRLALTNRLFRRGGPVTAAAAFRVAGVAGFLLGPAIVARAEAAVEVVRIGGSLERPVLQRFLEDAGRLMAMAPDCVDLVAPFLIEHGAFARVEQAIEKDGLRLRSLPGPAANRLAADILSDLQAAAPAKRQAAARWSYQTTIQALGLPLPYPVFEAALARESDPDTRCWIAMALSVLAASRSDVDTALGHVAEAATGSAEYSRDKAFVAWLDLVLAERRIDQLRATLTLAASPSINLKRLRDLAWRIPRILAMDRSAAEDLVFGMLSLPMLRGRTTLLESFRRVAKRPLIEWSQQADVRRIEALLDRIPDLDPLIGQLILEMAYIPAHADALRYRILRIGSDPDTPDSLRHYIPQLFGNRRANAESERWDLPPPAREPEVTKYDNALAVIIDAARAMEAQPEPFDRLKEDALRNVLLAALRGAYRGAASGESQNYGGKTDILVTLSHGSRFIAECKVWRGTVSFGKAVGQVLGYVAPRDDAVALVIFSKTRPNSFIGPAVDRVIRERVDFIRPLSWSAPGGLRFCLRHPRDAGRVLELSVFGIDLRQPPRPSAVADLGAPRPGRRRHR